jgi:spectinomycin phosphotransferase
MIEKPGIRDERIISVLRDHYSLAAAGLEFLPVGNDPSAWAYRVSTEDQGTYFLKIRKEISNPAGFLVPRFLQDHGIAQALAPFPTKKQELWIPVEGFFLILYPFVNGSEAMKVGMSDSQWTEFGSLLKQIHSTELPAEVSQHVRRETFVPKWSHLARDLQEQIHIQNYDDPSQKELAVFWKKNRVIIHTIVEQTERIGKHLQQADPEFVLCHADIHTANLLLTPAKDMFVVDWDDTLFAPRERDLMFILAGEKILTNDERLFFNGYGNIKINELALTYYRYEWCVQEIGDFGQRVFFTKDVGKSTKQNAVEGFMQLFSEGDVIETALNASMGI